MIEVKIGRETQSFKNVVKLGIVNTNQDGKLVGPHATVLIIPEDESFILTAKGPVRVAIQGSFKSIKLNLSDGAYIDLQRCKAELLSVSDNPNVTVLYPASNFRRVESHSPVRA